MLKRKSFLLVVAGRRFAYLLEIYTVLTYEAFFCHLFPGAYEEICMMVSGGCHGFFSNLVYRGLINNFV